MSKNLQYSKAYKEVWEILKFFPKDLVVKIPRKLIEIIKHNMDINYQFKVEHIEDFENQKMLPETAALLSIIYRDFMCSEEKKNEIKKAQIENQIRIENEKKEKYGNIFNSN